MNSELFLAILVVVLGASGTYLLLPHRHGSQKPRNVHLAGAALDGLALLLFALLWSGPGTLLANLFFYAFGFVAVAAGVLMVTARDPIHSALWFAAVVLSTTGLFLLAGAQFLAAGTVIVYAGAIIVTFLFVIMLAQMEGRAAYDRAARSPFLSTWTSFVILLALFWAILHVPATTDLRRGDTAALARTTELAPRVGAADKATFALVKTLAVRPTSSLTDAQGRTKPHVAGLGESLYTDHLVTVELAGAVLFAALIGAIAIATPKAPVRPGDPRVSPAATTR